MFFNLFILISSEQNKCEECERAFKKIIHKGNFNIKDREFPFCKGNQKCNSLSNTVHKKILQHISPRDYCSSIKLCHPTASSLSLKPRKTSSEITLHETDDPCQFCNDFLQYFFTEGIEDVSVPVIKDFLVKACEQQGLMFAIICKRFKDRNIRIFLDTMAAKFEFQEMCAQMDLCK